MRKVTEVHEDLHVWDREVLKKPVQRMKKLKKDLERLRRGPMTEESATAQKEILLRIELLLEQEELKWVQRQEQNGLSMGITILIFPPICFSLQKEEYDQGASG